MSGRRNEYRFPNREVKGCPPGSLAIIAKRPTKHDRHWRVHQIQKMEEMAREGARQTKALHLRTIRDGWMNKTDVKIIENEINKLKDQFYHGQNEKLEERRMKLRTLLSTENQLYEKIVDEMKETHAQRDDRLRKTVNLIREKNTAKHLQYIRPLLDAQFTLSCPDVRDGIVRQRALKVARECQATVAYKQERREMERQFQAFYDKIWLEDVLYKEAREEAEVERVEHLAKDRRDGLLKQLDGNNAQKDTDRQDRINDHEAITYLMGAHQESIRVELANKRRLQQDMRRQLDRHCELKELKELRSKEEEDAINAQMLERAKLKEAQAVTDEQANKRENAREYEQYLAYIRNGVKKVKDWEKAKDIRLAAKIRQDARRDQQKEENIVKEKARNERELKALQLEQIREKEVMKISEEIKHAHLQKEIVLRCERDHWIEDQKVIKRKEAAMKHGRELEGQIAFRAQQRELVKDSRKKELMAMAEAEEQYKQRAAELINRPPPLNKHPMAYVYDSQRFVFQSTPAYNLKYLDHGVAKPPLK